jgi:hypothetical protein
MKILYLVFVKLKSMITENKFIMFFFFIGVFVCNIMFIYAYGNLKTAVYESVHATYTIENTKRSPVDIDRTESELSDYVTRIEYSSMLDEKMFEGNADDSLDIKVYIDENKNQNENTYKEEITTHKEAAKFLLESGRASDLNNKNTIAVPKELLKNNDSFPNIKINNIEYKIIGTHYRGFIVSLETFKSNNLIPDKIQIVVDGSNHGAKKEKLEAKLQELFPDFTIIEPQEQSNDLIEAILLTSAIYLLCLFSLMYFMAYLFAESAYEMNIYEIIGAKRSKVITILCTVQFTIFIFISVLSLLIHRVFYRGFFYEVNMIDNVYYTAGDYLLCLALTVALALLFVFAYILARMRKSLIVNSRRFIS